MQPFFVVTVCHHFYHRSPFFAVCRHFSLFVINCCIFSNICSHFYHLLSYVYIGHHLQPFVTICYRSQTDRIDSVQLERSTLEGSLKRGLLIWVGPVLSEISRSTRPLQFSIETFLDISVKAEYSSIMKLPVSKKELIKTSKRDRAQFHWLKGHVTKALHVWLDK